MVSVDDVCYRTCIVFTKIHPLEIHYRLETIEDIAIALDGGLFEEADYKRLLRYAKENLFTSRTS
jgi:hypothetical protein